MFDDKLIEDLQHIATLSVVDRHYQVLTSLDFLARVVFLAAKDVKHVESSKYSDNQLEAVSDLSASNKRNKGIREGISKSICVVMNIISGPSVLGTMPFSPVPAKPAVPSKPSTAVGYLLTSSYIFILHHYS